MSEITEFTIIVPTWFCYFLLVSLPILIGLDVVRVILTAKTLTLQRRLNEITERGQVL